MNNYEVYLSETKAIILSADRWETCRDHNLLLFINDNTKTNVAVFNINNILGWVEV